MPRLIVLQGPNRGQIFDLGQNATIGRLSSNDIQLQDEQTSRQHARLEVSGRAVTVVDLGSSRGLEVNGRRVDRLRLTHGDSLTIGASVLRFEDAGQPDGPPPLPVGEEDPGRTMAADAVGAHGAGGGGGFRINPAAAGMDARPTAGPPPLPEAGARRVSARAGSGVHAGNGATPPRRVSAKPGSGVHAGVDATPLAPPRRASAKPGSGVRAGAGTDEAAGPKPARSGRLDEVRAARGTTWLEILVGTAILVVVFFASKWAGEEAVRRVSRPLPGATEDRPK